MHELSLAQELIEQIEAAAASEKALRVQRIVMTIGAYSGVERSAFEFAFPIAAEGTVAEGAELIIEEVEAYAVCGNCQDCFPLDAGQPVCTRCGSDRITLRGGRDFLIRSVDLEVP